MTSDRGCASPGLTCQKTPTISADGMSFALDCTLEAGKSYALGFSGGSYMNFKNEAGVAAVPSELHFSTTSWAMRPVLCPAGM